MSHSTDSDQTSVLLERVADGNEGCDGTLAGDAPQLS